MAFPAYTPKARVQKPAPHFSSQAVVDGAFEGTLDPWIPNVMHAPHDAAAPVLTRRIRGQPDRLHVRQEMARPRLRPHGLDLCVPYRDHCL